MARIWWGSRLFKQRSGYAYRRLTGDREVLWQKSYYDHVLRRDEDLSDAARYIWGNPVRAGLVDNARDYPYSGSLTIGDEWKVEGGGLKSSATGMRVSVASVAEGFSLPRPTPVEG